MLLLACLLASAVGAMQLGCGVGWRVSFVLPCRVSLGGTTDECEMQQSSDGYSELENDAACLLVQLISRF